MQVTGSNTPNHLICYECGSKCNVDVITRTNQGFWRLICLNCASDPTHREWYWRCTSVNCASPIIADNYMYCYVHHAMYHNWLTSTD
jgi:hypothetical protein